MKNGLPQLPIEESLPDLARALRAASNVVLVAPPGAGKTTRVPLALLDQPWVQGRKLLVLEPRRLAARAAAARMAENLAESVGETVGLRVRLESKVSDRTRVEVITDGVFTRMILEDPLLEDVAGVLFDEIHERSLEADFGLALALDAQSSIRSDLRILAMSATLDGARVASLLGDVRLGDARLGDARIIRSEGRSFPVETRYSPRTPGERIEDAMAAAVRRALREELGSILAFLPGAAEIARTQRLLAETIDETHIDLVPLHGTLDLQEQARAVEPAAPGRRKIVLATSIAETSLTIEGVRVVIDSGLARVPRFEPGIGVTRLETVKASRASADQRRGRAGRTEPGVCYRLWAEAANGAMEAFARPEILAADLSGLLLDCAAWGVTDPLTLRWLDPPPAAALLQAKILLQDLGALDTDGRLSDTGRRLRQFSLPPRLARMVLEGAAIGQGRLAADLAAVLSERGLGGDGVDLVERVERLRQDRSGRAEAMRRLARSWLQQAGAKADAGMAQAGRVLALAFPDRVAAARGRLGQFVMENGRGAGLAPDNRLAREPFLVIGELTGSAQAGRILSAAPITLEEIEALAGVHSETSVRFDAASLSLRATRIKRYRRLVLAQAPASLILDEDAARILVEGVARFDLSRLPWSAAQRQWFDRVRFLHAEAPDEWPNLSEAALRDSAQNWLAPHVVGCQGLASITPDHLDKALKSLLDWPLQRRLEAEAPSHFKTPAGSNILIDYAAEGGPAIAVRLQELFGLARHPTLAGGRVKLTIHLLSPAHRPVQVTKDLAGFWRGSYAAVRMEMKGRYPKHPWPEDPLTAIPTTRAKPRGT